VAGATADDIVALMVGREIEDLYPKSARTVGDVAVSVENLKGAKAPQTASFELRYGEVLGIAGLVGSGRTEMIRAIFGLDSVKSGSVKIADLTGNSSAAERWRQGIGFLSEDRKQEGLALSMSIADNATLSKLTGYGPMGTVLPSRQQKAAGKWIEKLEIKCASAKQKVDALSGGNQQKVALARLLAADCDVLLLDEPTRGVDVGAKAEIYRLIDEQAHAQNAAVLVVSSYLPELLGLCDRVAVVARGDVLPARAVHELDEHGLLAQMTAGRQTEGIA
ncbi:MAG: sugar ABC transporter ATP-binding protein, partial [Planctomycetes bacterium]|nr:sugar ABC transporter ATP-binding protein [Planctomycetota bacterium]